MAIKFKEVLNTRPGLLDIRQTRVEPTLKTLTGLGILCMLTYFECMTGNSSLII